MREYEKKLFLQTWDFIQQSQKPMQFPWQLNLSTLKTETVVESICSMIRAVFHDNRQKMKPKTLKKLLQVMMMLPDDDATRKRIVNWVAKQYFNRYGNPIIKDEFYKSVNRIADLSTVLDRKYGGKESLYTSTWFVLDEIDERE